MSLVKLAGFDPDFPGGALLAIESGLEAGAVSDHPIENGGDHVSMRAEHRIGAGQFATKITCRAMPHAFSELVSFLDLDA